MQTAALLLTWVAVAVGAAGVELRPGDTLGPDNWQQARGLLPDEFLESYRRGDFRHPVGAFAVERIGEDPVFAAALAENRGRYALTPASRPTTSMPGRSRTSTRPTRRRR